MTTYIGHLQLPFLHEVCISHLHDMLNFLFKYNEPKSPTAIAREATSLPRLDAKAVLSRELQHNVERSVI
jgi:hypothetical protein